MDTSKILLSKFNNVVLRPIDDLYRVVIPKEFRDRVLKENRNVYMQIIDDYILLTMTDENNSGIKKKLDKLGRFTLYKGVRELLDIHSKDEMFVWIYGDCILLQKKQDKCIFCNGTYKLTKYKDKNICKDCLNILYEMRKNIYKIKEKCNENKRC